MFIFFNEYLEVSYWIKFRKNNEILGRVVYFIIFWLYIFLVFNYGIFEYLFEFKFVVEKLL